MTTKAKSLRRRLMKKRILYILASLILIFLTVQVIQAAGHIPLSGETFPGVSLTTPEKSCEKSYLGLTGTGPFNISQVKGDLVILEIFNMYCPYCQKEAPIVNDLYQRINGDASLKKRVKILGVGTGNTLPEVNIFRDRYNVQFPLIPDESFTVHKAVGEVRTPYFFVIRLNPDRSNKLIYSKGGSIRDAGQFLEKMVHEAGLQ